MLTLYVAATWRLAAASRGAGCAFPRPGPSVKSYFRSTQSDLAGPLRRQKVTQPVVFRGVFEVSPLLRQREESVAVTDQGNQSDKFQEEDTRR